MYEYRVTKFDPAKRANDGTYLDQEEWTSAGEIGKTSDGQTLTEDYLLTEARYERAVVRFFEASQLPHLRITGLENRGMTLERLEDIKRDQPFLCEPEFVVAEYREDQTVAAEEISLLVTLNLRGIVECKMEIDGKFFVHFGWDFYMYVGCQADCAAAIAETEADGLFVERFTSPHRRPDDFHAPAKILVSDKINDVLIVDDEPFSFVGSEIVLADAKWVALRRLFGMSKEHPFFGYFDIDQAVADKLNRAHGLDLDLARCDYTLDTADQ